MNRSAYDAREVCRSVGDYFHALYTTRSMGTDVDPSTLFSDAFILEYQAEYCMLNQFEARSYSCTKASAQAHSGKEPHERFPRH